MDSDHALRFACDAMLGGLARWLRAAGYDATWQEGIDAGLGRKDDALREGRRACELLPISQDAVDGASLAVNLAHIYAWTGEKDLAIEQIAAIERVPNPLSYGLLKLHPYWDPLRGDPRFEEILSSLAPR